MSFEAIRIKGQSFLPFFALLLLISTSFSAQYFLEQRDQGRLAKIEQLRLLPKGDILRPALLGYHHLGADVLWLRVVQVLGDRVVRDKDYEWLYHALDVITTVDPKYVYAYEAGGVVLAELATRVDLSNRLLEKGLAPNPSSWQIPFRLGFNHFFHLGDNFRAAEYMGQAARIPGPFPIGPPHYTARLASRLYVQGKSPDVALEFLEGVLDQTTDELVRDKLQRRIRRVSLERDLQMLEQLVQQYTDSRGMKPASLRELVSAGFLSSLPAEPYGGSYLYDLKTGKVSSSSHDERMGVYRPADSLATRGDIE